MPVLDPTTTQRFAAARDRVTAALLAERNAQGHWTGELSSSALSTATAVCALAVFARQTCARTREVTRLIHAGLDWLATHANADGGWGDTDRSFSNISTTTLVWAAFGVASSPQDQERHRPVIDAAERWLGARVGGADGLRNPAKLAAAIAARYGRDRTFSIPILTMCAISGRLGEGSSAWRDVSQLPFELAALPASWFGALQLPVVSYALPALIAVGQVRHHFRPTRNPLTRLLRVVARRRTLRLLSTLQPPHGGFLEATPLTAFVTMSLAAMELTEHAVVCKGIDFLIQSARADGSWPIDTNLNTWLTTLAVNALGELPMNETAPIRDWLLGQQYRQVHPYTNAAPGGWAWTSLPGGVPDADDTAGALLALRRLGPVEDAVRSAAVAGVGWLLDLQNRDGGIPTFCKGWGALPFDRSSPDITAHALRAWVEWMDDLGEESSNVPRRALERAISRAIAFLASSQCPDGSWVPLWFGHQESADDENPLYGTARVVAAMRVLVEQGRWPAAEPLLGRGERWLVANQNRDGGWAGISGAASSVEETALALEALAGTAGQKAAAAWVGGAHWLCDRVESGDWRKSSPIGFYFARLWYYERLYPLIFAAAGLKGCARLRTKFVASAPIPDVVISFSYR